MDEIYEGMLDAAIEEAGRALNQMDQLVLNLNKRKHPIPSRNTLRGDMNFIQNAFDSEPTLPKDFITLFRMSRRLFDKLLSLVNDVLKDDATNSISPRDKLAMYLLFVGSGWTTHHIAAITLYGETTVRTHILGVSKAIIRKIPHFIETPRSTDEWIKIAKKFEERTCLPHCIGALDGKYIYIRKPNNAGSEWFCHKMRNAFVLMALVDSTYKFLWADIGSYGSNNDAFIFNSCRLCEEMEAGSLNIPEPSRLPDSATIFPYCIVGDDAFALRKWLMKPLKCDRPLSKHEEEANYRISLARRCVEQAFGILVKKFSLLQRPIQLSHANLIHVTQSILIVHNFLREESIQEDEEMCDIIMGNDVNLIRAHIADVVPFYVEQAPDRLRNALFQYLANEGRIPEQVGKNGNIS